MNSAAAAADFIKVAIKPLLSTVKLASTNINSAVAGLQMAHMTKIRAHRGIKWVAT